MTKKLKMSVEVDRKILNEEITKKVNALDKSKVEFVEIFRKIYEMGLHDGVDITLKAIKFSADE